MYRSLVCGLIEASQTLESPAAIALLANERNKDRYKQWVRRLMVFS
jgi:hypothetical protein